MDLVVDSELLQPNQAVKTVFVHCTWYRRCLWTPHIIFYQIHDVEFLALFEHFAWFPNNVPHCNARQHCTLSIFLRNHNGENFRLFSFSSFKNESNNGAAGDLPKLCWNLLVAAQKTKSVVYFQTRTVPNIP